VDERPSWKLTLIGDIVYIWGSRASWSEMGRLFCGHQPRLQHKEARACFIIYHRSWLSLHGIPRCSAWARLHGSSCSFGGRGGGSTSGPPAGSATRGVWRPRCSHIRGNYRCL